MRIREFQNGVDDLAVVSLIEEGGDIDWVLANRATTRNGLVAVANGQVIGYADCENDGSLTQVFVRDDHQRTGVGKALMLALLKAQDELFVDPQDIENAGVLQFLVSCGFVMDVDSGLLTLGASGEEDSVVVRMPVRVRVSAPVLASSVA